MATSADAERPHAIIIAKCTSTKFEINFDGLAKIFQKPEQNIPISIITIAGAFRGGKSFILNFFLRYLRRKGYENKNWMGNQYEPLIDGFEWKTGEDSCTNGILIWSEIFYVMKDGKKVAIMLMDTQGLFDSESDKNVYTRIFALSTLISSVQVFNLFKRIDANDLEYLELFTTYAQAATRSNQKSAPFQTLVFLIRDFPYGEKYGYGVNAGNEFLQNTLDKNTSEMSTSIKRHLNTTFSDIKCLPLPHPGKEVADKSKFNGSLKDIDTDFCHHTAALVEEFLKPDNIVVKTIAGNVVYAKSILLYIRNIGKKFANGKLPDIHSMTESTIKTQNFQAQRTSIEEYCKIMVKNVTNDYVKQDDLLKMHHQARSRVLKLFETMTTLGEEYHRQEHREYLIDLSEREYKRLFQTNERKMNEAKEKIRESAEKIKKNYEAAMNQVTKGIKPIDDKTLNEAHKRNLAEAKQTWDKINGPEEIKTECFIEIEHSIAKKLKSLTKYIDEKKKEGEARKICLDIHNHYIKKWDEKMIKGYINESDFRGYDENLRSSCRYSLVRRLIDLGIYKTSSEFDDHVNTLDENMDVDISQIKTRNSDQKKLLEIRLEKNRSRAYEEYDEAIKKLLNDTYMAEALLKSEHDKIVKKLVEDLKSDDGDSSMISKHVEEAEREFEAKYSDTKQMNIRNQDFLQIIGISLGNAITKTVDSWKKVLF